jgi:hypothetical protein
VVSCGASLLTADASTWLAHSLTPSDERTPRRALAQRVGSKLEPHLGASSLTMAIQVHRHTPPPG